MPNQHRSSPVSFRPPEEDRAWLRAEAERSGRSVGSLLSEALALLRRAREES